MIQGHGQGLADAQEGPYVPHDRAYLEKTLSQTRAPLEILI